MVEASAIVGSVTEILLVQPLKNIPQSSLATTVKEAELVDNAASTLSLITLVGGPDQTIEPEQPSKSLDQELTHFQPL